MNNSEQIPESTPHVPLSKILLNQTVSGFLTESTLAEQVATEPRATSFTLEQVAAAQVEMDDIPTAKNIQRIEILAEKLFIHKQKVDFGEVVIRREMITEIKTFEVPIQREELIVERIGLAGEPVTEIVRITLSEERVNIEKKLVILEEVDISKCAITEIQQISEILRHEELCVEGHNETE